MSDPEPKDPREAGVPESEPPLAEIEGARELASDARDRLESKGFTYDQIRRWADTYVTEKGSGDVEAFIAWIDEQEDST